MKKLSLNLNVEGLELGAEVKNLSPREIAVRAMTNMMVAHASDKRGLSYHDQRKFNKIIDALEDAIKTNEDPVTLEDDWFGFLRKTMLEGKMLPSKLINRVFDLIDAVKYD